MNIKHIKISMLIMIFAASIIYTLNFILIEENSDIDVSNYVAEQILSYHQNQPKKQSQVTSSPFKSKQSTAQDIPELKVDKDELADVVIESLSKVKQNRGSSKSKLPSNKKEQLKELDEKLLAYKPVQYSVGEDGKLSGVFPKYSQSFSNSDEFVESASELLDLDNTHQLIRKQRDCLNGTQCITKYHRTAHNYPILRDNVVITLKQGNVKSVMGALTAPNIDPQVLSGSNTLTRDDIEKAARGSLSQDYQIEGEPLFGVYETALAAIPAYQVIITNGNDGYDMIIHARTKAVASKVSLVHHANASGVDLNGALYEFNAIQGNDAYRMIDDRFPLNAKTILLDADRATQEELNQNSPLYYQSSNTLNGGWDPSAVSALSHFDALVSYFEDNNDYSVILPGAQDMQIIVNANMENALAGLGTLVFGRTDISNYANSRDVVAHELTHSIIQATSNLNYERQSGALNESFADLFGVLASGDGNWLIGEDIRASGNYLRNMANPADAQTSLFAPLGYPQPFHLSQYKILPINEDKGGVHIYSGIPNRFFYLLAEGNSENPLGRQRTGQLAFDAMVGLNANATFSDFYLKMQSVTDTEAELNAVLEAGKGVGFDLYDKSEIDFDISVRPSGENATVFLTPNFLNDSYDVNLQVFDSNNRTYEASQLFNLATKSTSQQPAAAYFGNGVQEELAVIFKEYDGSIEYIYLNSIDGFGQKELLSSEIAAATNRINTDLSLKYYATSHKAGTQIADEILLIETASNTSRWIQPTGPSFTEGYEGASINQIDVIEFDPTGRFIAFDFLTKTLDGEQYWSIGILDIDSGAIRYPFANVPNYFDLGNPSFANTNSDYVVFDVYNSQTEQASIYILNLVDGSLIPVSGSQLVGVDGAHLGLPSFTQNDNAIVFKVKTGTGYFDQYLYSIGLDSQYQSVGDGQYLNNVNVSSAQKTVRGQVYKDELTLTAEVNSFDVGDFTQEVTGQFCLTNSATHPIRIRSTLEDSGLALIDIPFHYAGGKKVCSSFLVNGKDLPLGKSNLTATINHDGTSEPVLITVLGNKLADNDNDGIADINDPDDDNDGVLDAVDTYPLISVIGFTDTDSDGSPDTCNEACVELGMTADTDDDNDGVLDTADAYPLASLGNLSDTDADGAPDTCDSACVALGMAADSDDDNDGISDAVEIANGLDPLNSNDALQDADNDGVSNIDEIAAGSDVNADDQPPVFTSIVEDIEVISTGLATTVELVNPSASDVTSDVVVTNDSDGEFPVGISTVTYTATDVAGNTAKLTQQINVLPYIVISPGQSLGDGQTVNVTVSLNGTPAAYPVTSDIIVEGTASSDDFTLSTTTISITEGLTQTIELTAVDDGFGDSDETIILSLANVVNAGIKADSDGEQTFTITEESVLPSVSVSVEQNDVIGRMVDKQSEVRFDIDIADPNGLDSLIVEWSGIEGITEVASSNDLALDPSALTAGVYVLNLSVTDNDVAGDNVVNQLITIKVIENLPQLTSIDSDGDGISDVEEGLGDSDNDGIADYLDNTPQINLQPLGDTFAQAQDGVLLALGATALSGDDNSIAIDATTLPEDTTYEYEEVFDFTLTGLAVGASYDLVLPLSQSIPENAVYRKLTDNGWVDFVVDANNAVHSVIAAGGCPAIDSDLWVAGLITGGNCIKLTIQDGSYNDTDGLKNGTIEDPSGVAVVKASPTPTPTPNPNPTTPSSGSGSSGGSANIQILILLWIFVIGRRVAYRTKD